MRGYAVLDLIIFFLVSPLAHSFKGSETSKFSAKSNSNLISQSARESSYILICTEDGAISLVDMSCKKIVWTFQTNKPIYSSYKAPRYHYNQYEDRAPALDGDFYIDLDQDFRLYNCSMRNGKCINEIFDASKLIARLPYLGRDKVIYDEVKASMFLLNWRTGKLVKMYTATAVPYDKEKALKSGFDKSADMVSVMRTDYRFQCVSIFGDVLWSVFFSKMEAKFMGGLSSSSAAGILDTQLYLPFQYRIPIHLAPRDKNPWALLSNKDPEEVLFLPQTLILLILCILFVSWLFKPMKELYASKKKKAKKKTKQKGTMNAVHHKDNKYYKAF